MAEEIVEDGGEKTIPYSRFKEVNDQRTALDARVKELETQAAALQQQAATFETTRKEIEGKISAADQARAVAEARALRLEVAASKGLPLTLADRLRGDKREEMEADAEGLLPLLKLGNPGVPPPGGAPVAPLKIGEMSPAQIRAAYDEGKLLK